MEELKNKLNQEFIRLGKNLCRDLRYNKSFAAEIIEATPFLSEKSLMSERVYCLLNNISKVPSCKMCPKAVKFDPQINYRTYCSTKCLSADPEILIKRRLGIDDIATNKKREDTIALSNNGIRNYSQTQEGRLTLSKNKLEHYSDPVKKETTLAKFEQTNLNKTGYRNPAQVPENQEKSKQTSLENWGYESYLQTDKCREESSRTAHTPEAKLKTIETNKARYGEHIDNTFKLEKSIVNRNKALEEKFGGSPFNSDEVREKAQNTRIAEYGNVNYLQSEAGKQRMIEICGEDNYFKSEIGKQHIKQVHLEKRGVEHPMQDPAVRERFKQTNLLRLGYEYPLQSPVIKEVVRKKRWVRSYRLYTQSPSLLKVAIPRFLEEEYKGANQLYPWECPSCQELYYDYVSGYINGGALPRCLKCNPLHQSVSKYETEIEDYIKTLIPDDAVRNSRKIIPPKELDLYYENYKFAIEFNGLAWHSEIGIYKRWKNKKLKEGDQITENDTDTSPEKITGRHLSKTLSCEKLSIRLFHIFEDEWVQKKEIVKSIIKHQLRLTDRKIGARACKVLEIESEILEQFLFNNHLNTPIPGTYKYGLYSKDELVSVLSLGEYDGSAKAKPGSIGYGIDNKRYQFRVFRSGTKINTFVAGGFSKLIKHAVEVLKIKSLVNYVDRRYFTGTGCKDEHKNWEFLGETTPQYEYVDPNYTRRFNRTNFMKCKLKDLFPEHYDANLTEWQIMQLADYDRVWNCGVLKYEYKPNRKGINYEQM